MKRHGADVVSVTLGSVFLVVVAWWLLVRVVRIDLPEPGWVLATVLVLSGLLGVFGTLRAMRRQP